LGTGRKAAPGGVLNGRRRVGGPRAEQLAAVVVADGDATVADRFEHPVDPERFFGFLEDRDDGVVEVAAVA
jgi:hypothetical protein